MNRDPFQQFPSLTDIDVNSDIGSIHVLSKKNKTSTQNKTALKKPVPSRKDTFVYPASFDRPLMKMSRTRGETFRVTENQKTQPDITEKDRTPPRKSKNRNLSLDNDLHSVSSLQNIKSSVLPIEKKDLEREALCFSWTNT